jgi:RNA polymerase sigma factor (sigma-70 family)
MSSSPTTCPASAPDARPADELLRGAARGDEHAWVEIVERYRGLIGAVVRSFRLQDADARDAEQRTWLRLVENCERVRDPERLGGWLSTTAARECLRILRESRASVPLEIDVLPDPGRAIEDRVVDADTVARIHDIVDALPARGRTVMRELFAEEPRPYADIAMATGIPIGSLGPTRRRLLHRVRATFEKAVVVG